MPGFSALYTIGHHVKGNMWSLPSHIVLNKQLSCTIVHVCNTSCSLFTSCKQTSCFHTLLQYRFHSPRPVKTGVILPCFSQYSVTNMRWQISWCNNWQRNIHHGPNTWFNRVVEEGTFTWLMKCNPRGQDLFQWSKPASFGVSGFSTSHNLQLLLLSQIYEVNPGVIIFIVPLPDCHNQKLAQVYMKLL
jgi:hypothetical protein